MYFLPPNKWALTFSFANAFEIGKHCFGDVSVVFIGFSKWESIFLVLRSIRILILNTILQIRQYQ